ncbi:MULTISPECIES: beta-mannosidase [unclassified Gordonia (in: high G+C Gram-positive bacteria)]|uniref:beta-mannosidase n=1 Tax=unclassified Gordonia (in: high G+C Gram-positive bacteria) TaxID=2657482 RepID=UPI0019668C47|nr:MULTISPECIES: beta-mannosidase [unclassified Gordonia (in: high G+C Gram-positive bacteria)]MBN0975166.1 beta-mannosidase [Gordonia sp. BP-119]MBN0985310.1 beta-mannosidase [Gordonia sp. BP-94]
MHLPAMRTPILVLSIGLLLSWLLPPPAHAAPNRVDATPAGLTLDGRQWWPSGFDAYQLATDWSVNAGCGAMVDLDDYFAGLPPHSLTRFNLFAQLAVNKYTQQLDFGPMDAVFDAAARHGQMVLPVLAAADGACESEVFKERDWYRSGWRTVAGAGGLTFEQWVRTAVGRWKSRSALAGWELVGEPEPSICGDQSCGWQQRSCPVDAARVLRSFFGSAGAMVTRLHGGAVIWSGFTGGGQCGTAGPDYQYVAGSPYVDVLDYHDYGADGVALPGDQWNGLAERLRQARVVGKPLAVNEIGQHAGSCGSTSERADDFRTKVAGQRAAGTATALFWAFVPDPRHDQCTYDIGPGDPVHELVSELTSLD